jgi:hypothetical protein
MVVVGFVLLTTESPVQAKDFRPAKALKGKTYKVKGADARFTLPKGWKVAVSDDALAITNSKFPGSAIGVTSKMLTAKERNTSVADLLTMMAREEIGELPVKVISGPSSFTVGGKSAGQLILEGDPGGGLMRARFAAIKIDTVGIALLALYKADADASVGPAFETILSTFRGKAPKQNTALMAKISGCWEHYYSSEGSSSTTRFRFDAQGSYDYHHYTSISVAGAGATNESKEVGSYTLFGTSLSTQSNGGVASSYQVSTKGGMLYLGNTRYLPCS